MSDVANLTLAVDSRQVKDAASELNKLSAAGGKAEGQTKQLTTATKQFSTAYQSLKSVVAAGAILEIGLQVTKAIDSFTKFNAQLRNATKSQEEFNEASANVARIATKAQTDIGALGTTYARFNNSLRDLGATQKEVSNVTETLALALKANGATAEEASATLLQLSQAFGKGKLDGDEFRTAMEAAPNVMRELAKSLGVPFGALKDLAAQGQLTSEVLLKAFNNEKLLDSLNKQADATRTIGGQWKVFTNNLILAIGKMNEATGASKLLIGSLEKAATLLSVFQGGEKGSILRNYLDSFKERDLKQDSNETLKNLTRGRFAGATGQRAAEELKRRAALPNAGVSFGGVITSNDKISPNFNKTVEVQDVDEIHKNQERLSIFKSAK